MPNRLPHVPVDDAGRRDDEAARQLGRDRGERDMDRHRNDGEQRRPDHHHGLRRAAPGLREFAEKFGVAGMGEAGLVERLLGDRIGDDRLRGARADIADGAFDQFDSRGGEIGMRLAGPRPGGVGERRHRQRMLEGAERLGGIDDGDRHGEGQASREFGERVRVREREERRRDRIARQPGAQQQFRADPGGIAHRHRDRRCVHGRISERRGQ